MKFKIVKNKTEIEQMLEDIDPVNKEFLQKGLKSSSPKIYKNGELPCEISDEYLKYN